MTSGECQLYLNAAVGQLDTIELLEELKLRFELYAVCCVALRLFRADGTWEDKVIGGDETERAEAFLALHRSRKQSHQKLRGWR